MNKLISGLWIQIDVSNNVVDAFKNFSEEPYEGFLNNFMPLRGSLTFGCDFLDLFTPIACKESDVIINELQYVHKIN